MSFARKVANNWPDGVRWFDGLGNCRCGKPANGWLMSTRNERMAVVCRACGEKAVRGKSYERIGP